MGVQGFQQGLADQMLAGYRRSMGGAGTAGSLNQGLDDDAVLDVEGQLASALRRRAAAHAVGKTGNLADVLDLDPAALNGQFRRPVALGTVKLDLLLYFR